MMIPNPNPARRSQAVEQIQASIASLESTLRTQRDQRVLRHIKDSFHVVLQEHERELHKDYLDYKMQRVRDEAKSVEASLPALSALAKLFFDKGLFHIDSVLGQRLVLTFEESRLPESPSLVQTEAATDEDSHGS